MKKPILILLIVVLVIAIAGTVWFIVSKDIDSNTNTVGNNNSNSSIVNKNSTINTEREAINWVENNSNGLENFSSTYKDTGSGELMSSAHFYEEKNYWYVSFWPEGTVDLWYEVHLSPAGTIIYEGQSAGG